MGGGGSMAASTASTSEGPFASHRTDGTVERRRPSLSTTHDDQLNDRHTSEQASYSSKEHLTAEEGVNERIDSQRPAAPLVLLQSVEDYSSMNTEKSHNSIDGRFGYDVHPSDIRRQRSARPVVAPPSASTTVASSGRPPTLPLPTISNGLDGTRPASTRDERAYSRGDSLYLKPLLSQPTEQVGSHDGADLPLPSPPSPSRSMRHNFTSSFRQLFFGHNSAIRITSEKLMYMSHHQPATAILMCLWFVTSLASLFFTKHVLAEYPVNEAVFTLSQFATSVGFGLIFTKVLRLHPLTKLSYKQLRQVVPLSSAFLVKEILKYMSIARVSVNLVNTIRSLGPLFSVGLEMMFMSHYPPRAVVFSIVPIVAGVGLTSLDEVHAASSSSDSFVAALIGLGAAVMSTAINQSQNIYSKILFGKERIDPVCLQIYLSAISLILIAPFSIAHTAYELVFLSHKDGFEHFFAMPSPWVCFLLLSAGFVNFVSAQLAFNTLSKISPVSYSVANTFKRVCIAVIAITCLGERLSLANGAGIAVSIAGVFAYEKASRDYKEARQYRASLPQAKSSNDVASFNTLMEEAARDRERENSNSNDGRASGDSRPPPGSSSVLPSSTPPPNGMFHLHRLHSAGGAQVQSQAQP